MYSPGAPHRASENSDFAASTASMPSIVSTPNSLRREANCVPKPCPDTLEEPMQKQENELRCHPHRVYAGTAPNCRGPHLACAAEAKITSFGQDSIQEQAQGVFVFRTSSVQLQPYWATYVPSSDLAKVQLAH